MTEATKAPMCQKPGCRMMAQSNSDYCEEYHSDLEPAAPGPTEMVSTSRLLAVEAELGRAKAELAKLRTAGEMLYGQVMLWAGSDDWTEEDSRSALAWRAAKAAPLSPPVAPEPAQEGGGVERVSHSGAGGGDEDGYDMTGASGPTTHRDIRNYFRACNGRFSSAALAMLLLYVDRQEQAEREAAGLREQVQRVITERDNAWYWLNEGKRELAKTESDRDAERTQKERLRVELDRLHSVGNQQDRQFELAIKERDALRAENEGLRRAISGAKSQLRELVTRTTGMPYKDACGELWEKLPTLFSQQPAEAAPVAKAEAPSEPAVTYCPNCKKHVQSATPDHRCACGRYLETEPEAPSDPAGWVPRFKVGDSVRCNGAIESVTVRQLNAEHRSVYVTGEPDADGMRIGAWVLESALEPAPQPPATTQPQPQWDGVLFAGLPSILDDMRDAVKGLSAEHPTHASVARLIEFSSSALGFMNTLYEHLKERQ